MNKTLKWALIILAVLIVLGLIVWLIISLQSDNQVVYQPAPGGGGGSGSQPCQPFTQGQYDSAVKACNSKCGGNWAVPVIGAGLYAKCLTKCKSQINNGYGVVMC